MFGQGSSAEIIDLILQVRRNLIYLKAKYERRASQNKSGLVFHVNMIVLSPDYIFGNQRKKTQVSNGSEFIGKHKMVFHGPIISSPCP